MRPHTPNINTEMRRPTSPPETPPPGSPAFPRVKAPNGRASPSAKGVGQFNPALGGVGSQFLARGGVRPEAISPQESTSDEEEESDSDSDDSDASDGPPQPPASYMPRDEDWDPIPAHLTTTTVEIEETFTFIEQDEDDMESDDCDGDNPPLQPDSVEDAESSRSGSACEVPEEMLNGISNMSCGDESDMSGSEYEEDELIQHLRRMREQKRLRRLTSVSKRTVSERGSDSDREDLQPYDLGENTTERRVRRKLATNHRLSLISNPHDIIIELAEPRSDEEMSGDEGDSLFQFWRLMEVDDAE
ncbi:hypothetical protein PG993_000122 [Apiospora rasikravindrae]|uniref:Uncharacterized protein n=1 Tax=Apiospora rasikravindrae TaxID=990691 RepID=A0ABR1U7Q1_9PEZI